MYLSGGQCSDLEDDDCREFFDKDYNSYKVYYSKTVVVTDDCHVYRRTADTQEYKVYPSESLSCSSTNNLCREYKTNSGYNYQNIIETYITRTGKENWSGDIENRKESVKRDDYSLKLSGKMKHKIRVGDLEEGKLYTLEFLAKGSGNITAKFIGGTLEATSNIAEGLNNQWKHYSLKIPNNSSGLTASQIDNNNLEITGNAYIDNIVLKEMESLLVIKDSWETPEICDLPVNGEHLGCEAYKDDGGNDINLRRFSKLCFDDVAGCELVIDSNKTKINKNDDELKYFVLDDRYKCDGTEIGCTKMGLITLDRDTGAYSFDTVYNIIDESNPYQVCNSSELYCKTYENEEERVYNFKDPLGRVCEFKIENGQGNWYKEGSDELCEERIGGNSHCVGGVSLRSDGTCIDNNDCTNLAYPGEPGLCTNWVGKCDSSDAGCKEYQDPQNPKDCDSSLPNYIDKYTDLSGVDNSIEALDVCDYYYYKNVEECDSGVDPSKGCVGFNSTNNPNKNIRSYKVCESVEGLPACESDEDCISGRCVYTNRN